MFNAIMKICGYPFGWLMWALYQVVSNYGVALLLFTIVVKLLLFPLALKQQKSTIKMQLFLPCAFKRPQRKGDRHGIVPGLAERLTAHQTAHGQQRTPKDPEPPQGGDSVRRAGGGEPASWRNEGG